ncbi:MAG: cation diffusion facilitator family transporter [Patescibacteria group bacterium]|jgi:cation diffusion facilitator family transporter
MMNKKESVALSSVLASAGMTIMKFVVGIMTGSMGIISEAAHSALDLGAAGLTLFAVKVSDKPADDDHPFGHGKIESVSALIETGLLFLTSAWIIYEAVHRLVTKNTEVEITWYAFAVIIISIIIDISRSRALSKIAKETNSQALEADALHFSSDIWSSAVVLIGLALVFIGVKGADTFAAIGVSFFVMFAGYRLGKRTIAVLIDTAPEGITDIVKEIVGKIDGIINVEKVRVRPLGPSVSIEIEVGINRGFSIIKVDEVVKKAKQAVQDKIPGADIVVHTKPIQLKDETMVDIIRTISSKHGHSVHNIVIDNLSDKKFVSYDLELPSSLTVGEANKIVKHLEKDVQNEVGLDVELNTHVDPLLVKEATSEKLPTEEVENIKKRVADLILGLKIIKDPHNILVRKIGAKMFITLHCYADANETIEASHNVARRYKLMIKENISNVDNVIVHVEPRE